MGAMEEDMEEDMVDTEVIHMEAMEVVIGNILNHI